MHYQQAEDPVRLLIKPDPGIQKRVDLGKFIWRLGCNEMHVRRRRPNMVLIRNMARCIPPCIRYPTADLGRLYARGGGCSSLPGITPSSHTGFKWQGLMLVRRGSSKLQVYLPGYKSVRGLKSCWSSMDSWRACYGGVCLGLGEHNPR